MRNEKNDVGAAFPNAVGRGGLSKLESPIQPNDVQPGDIMELVANGAKVKVHSVIPEHNVVIVQHSANPHIALNVFDINSVRLVRKADEKE